MQDPGTFQAVKPHFPEQEQLKCPRCESTNTKFCYYNNYNLSQPRHFCKNCRRYWTKGGTLRNIPVGGGSRKNTKRSSNPKRSSSSSSSSTSSTSLSTPPAQAQHSSDHPKSDPNSIYGHSVVDNSDRRMLDIPGSFSSLLTSNGQFGSLLEGLNPNGSGVKMVQLGEFVDNMNLDSGRTQGMEGQSNSNSNSNSESFLGLQNGGDSNCWGGGSNGWPDLAIYTPGSSFQ